MKTDIYSQLKAYEKELLRFALKLTNNHEDNARDLLQESMLRMINGSSGYRSGSNLKAWSFTIVRNTYINIERRRKVE